MTNYRVILISLLITITMSVANADECTWGQQNGVGTRMTTYSITAGSINQTVIKNLL